ncbi:MAG: hypothetical protein ABI461_05155 [Polyangiaceae bacterium]
MNRRRHHLASCAITLALASSVAKLASAEGLDAAPGMNPEANGEARGDSVPVDTHPAQVDPAVLGRDSLPVGEGDVAPKEPDQGSTSYWAKGSARPFVSTTIDIGYLYFRPRISLGYGKPFRTWVGVDVNPQAADRFLGAYAGLRAALPNLELRVGARYVWEFQQAYLTPMDGFHRFDFQSTALGRSSYTALEAELTGAFPLGPGAVLAIASGTIITGVPSNVDVYDETLRVISMPPYIWRGRLGYAVRLGVEGKISIGVVADVLGLPGRGSSGPQVFRAGFIASAALSNHVEVLGSFVPPLISPDSIGVPGGDFAQLGVRFRWATGSPAERTMLIQDRYQTP